VPTVQIVTSMDCEKLPRDRRICCNLDEVSPVIFFLLAERFRARASLNMWAKAKGMTAASVPIRVRVSNPPPLASSTNDRCSIIAVNTPPVQTHPELHDPGVRTATTHSTPGTSRIFPMRRRDVSPADKGDALARNRTRSRASFRSTARSALMSWLPRSSHLVSAACWTSEGPRSPSVARAPAHDL
jgi:hypothetical protein